MKFALFLLLAAFVTRDGISFKFGFSKIGRGFKSMVCRMKHRKVVLDANNRYDRCERKCPLNYREKYSLHWGHHCKPILKPDGCVDDYCVRCLPGYKWIFGFNKRSQCVIECPKGYWTTSFSTCTKCTVEDCEECTDNWTCIKCNARTALYKTFMKSVICVNKCPIGYVNITNQDGLQECKQKKVATTKVTSTLSSTTITTINIGCLDENCVACTTGYFKYYLPEGGSECLTQCPVGHSSVGTLCVACSDKRCASCQASLAECDKCYPGYSMLLDSFNITAECVRDCPKKYEKKIIDGASACIRRKQQKCPVANCNRCLRSNLHVFHGGCEECSENFILFRGSFRDYCYTSCPAGYYETTKRGTKTRICAKCLSPFCSKCDKSTCLKCMEPMIMDKAIQKCTACPVLTDYNFKTKTCVRLGQLISTPRGNVIY